MARSVEAPKGPPGWPNRLSDEQAAAHVGLRPTKFLHGVATGELPLGKALAGEILWSRRERDDCLDAAPAVTAGTPDADPPFGPIADAIKAMGAHRC